MPAESWHEKARCGFPSGLVLGGCVAGIQSIRLSVGIMGE
jgi:hypothetical protein